MMAGVKRKIEAQADSANKKSCVSDIRCETVEFTWTLKNYKKMAALSEMKGSSVRSPVFTGGCSKYAHEWVLDVTPRKVKDGMKYLKICLKLKKSGNELNKEKPVKARFTISLIDMNDRLLKSKPSTVHDFIANGTSWGFRFIPSLQVEDPSRGILVDDGDTLNIRCSIEIFGKVSHQIGLIPRSPQIRQQESLELLKNDMKTLIDDGDYSDCTIVTPTKAFHVHKNILAARSPVFKAMFRNSSMLEARKSSVEIDDFPDYIIDCMIHWIYTGHTPALQRNAVDLLRISDKYELLGLKEICEEIISASVTVADAAELYALAHLHSPDKLKPKIVSFISRFRKEVQATESFMKVKATNPIILVDLLTALN